MDIWLILIILYAAWVFYMMTFRTSDSISLMKADQDRKDRQSERVGKAAKGTVSIIRWFLKK